MIILLLGLLQLGHGQSNQIKATRYRENQRPGECAFSRGNWCDYEQDPDDDLDWSISSDGYALILLNQHQKLQYGRLLSPFIRSKNTHCVEFSYRIMDGLGQLSVYVVENNLMYQNPVWTSPGHVENKWIRVQLALNPTKYKIVFQGKVLSDTAGEIGLDDIKISETSCSDSPHFLRLGDIEVNEAQSAEIQCLAYGRSYWGTEIKLQMWDGAERTTAERAHDMIDYQSAKFEWKSIKKSDDDKIRCVASNATAAGVSNYAKLVVKTQPVPIRAPEVETAEATFLIVRLNVQLNASPPTYAGDGPITGMDFYYRKYDSKWEDKHSVLLNSYNGTYHIWHLEPDTLYELAVRLSRPGPGGSGKLGPKVLIRTRCAKPQPLTEIMADPLKGKGIPGSEYSDNLAVRWAKPSENHAGCRHWSYTVRWRELGGIWKLKELEKDENKCVLSNLKSFTDYEVIVAVRNVAGTTESNVVATRTMDGLPEAIPTYEIKTFPTENSIMLQWRQPAINNGKIVKYKLSYKYHSNFQNLPNSGPDGQSAEIDGYTTTYTISDLIPGALYNISLSAKTVAGYGRASELAVRTKIGRPVFDGTSRTEPVQYDKDSNNPFIVELFKAESNGAPISRYNVIVEPARDLTRRKRAAESSCFKREVTYNEFVADQEDYYYAAELRQADFQNDVYNFEVGDGRNYTGYFNAPLDSDLEYKIWFQAISVEPNCMSNCDISANCYIVASTDGIDINDIIAITTTIATDNGEGATGAIEAGVAASSESVMLYSIIATVTLLVIFVFVGGFVCKSRRNMLRAPEQYHITTAETDLYKVPKSDSKIPGSSYGGPYEEKKPLMPDLVEYPSSSRRSEAEDFAVRVEDFPIHVSQMRCSRTYGFSDEFETLPEGGTASWDVAQRPENIQKNRYNNILPYDHSRVILRTSSQIVSSGDYINASWISGYGVRYIAAQGPTDQTIQDFWHCVYQENIRLVIMVTGLVEVGRRKCHQYWPNQVGVPEQFGSFILELISEQSQAHYTVRDIKIKLGTESRTVKQMQYHSWPDHGVPARSTSLLQFVRRSAQLNQDNQPILVHCSAGSGRSGCFIVLDWMLRMADAEGLLDIYNTVKELRHRRVNMVANLEQYIFLHDSLLEAVLCGETGVTSSELSRHYDQLITVSNGNAPIQEEFETLTVLTPRLTTEECQTARLARNRPKNRFMDVLPADRDLPYLITPDPAGSDPSNNYINAVFGDSFLTRRDIIITQMPLPHTVGDFWRLIHDYNVSVVVMLNDKTENDDSTQQYWPEEESKTYGAFTVECLSKDDEIELVSRTLKLTNYYRPSDPCRMVKQLQLTNWPVNQPVPSSRNSVLRLSSLIDQWRAQQETPTRVLIHCVAGAGRSGTFAGSLCVIQQLKSIQSADVFSSVLQLRAVRPQLVETLDQYRFIYEVAMEYADSQNL